MPALFVGSTYLQDSPRVILVVSNAAVAHSPLGHDRRVETVIGERTWTSMVGFATSDKFAHCSIPPVLLLNETVLASSHVQVDATTREGSEGD